MNSPEDFLQMGRLINKKLPRGVLSVGIYNRSDGFLFDIFGAAKEKLGYRTRSSENLRVVLSNLLDTIYRVDDRVKMFHFSHSRNGAIIAQAYRDMSSDYKELVRSCMYVGTFGAAECFSCDNALDAWNTYSCYDRITGWFAKEPSSSYKVDIIQGKIPFSKREGYFFIHSFCSDHYQQKLEELISLGKTELGGFYHVQTR